MIFDIFVYLKKSIELMNAEGYYHSDLHSHNIMYLDPGDKSKSELLADIKALKINPHNFYIVDYGLINHKKFIQTNADIRRKSITHDLVSLVWWSLIANPVRNYMFKHNIPMTEYFKSVDFLRSHKIYRQLVSYLPSYVKADTYLIQDIGYLHLICSFIDYNVYCESIGGTAIQEKLKLVNYVPYKKDYYLSVIKNMKKPDL